MERKEVVELLRRAASLSPDDRETFVTGIASGRDAVKALLEESVANLKECPDLLQTAVRGPSPFWDKMLSELELALGGEAELEPAAVEEVKKIGSIRIEARLGVGGMGEVYRGFDEKLERRVAVKTVKAAKRLSPDAKARFIREARILSKLNHPAICQAYDLIETDEADYLVLEYVEGQTLRKRLTEPMDSAGKMRLAVAIADALAAAHDMYVVHRDLKPDNIMITTGGGVKVLDFGIARSGTALGLEGQEPLTQRASGGEPASQEHTEVGGLTATGAVLGTPRFMSPEQIRGEPVSSASDVYSYGLLLQELFTGKPAYPHDLSLGETAVRVAQGNTAPIEGLDPDLTQLIRGLTSVNPTLRPSARDASERLRWIDGKPARIRRKRIRIAVTAGVAAIAVAAGIAVIAYRYRALRQVEVARRFSDEAKDIEWLLRAEHLIPVHDMRPARARIEKRLPALENTMRELGRYAVGPGNAALGRAYLGMLEYDKARAHLDGAWAAGYRTPDVACALGQAIGEQYKKAIEGLRGISGREERQKKLAALQREYRDPAVSFLRAAAGSSIVPADYVHAQIAAYEKRYDDALSAARRAFDQVPWFYEAKCLEGEVLSALTLDQRRAGKIEEAQDSFQRSVDAYHDAARIGESDIRAYVGLVAAWLDLLYFQVETRRGGDRETLDKLLSAVETGVRIDPVNLDILTDMAHANALWANYLLGHGLDPTAAVQASIDAGRRAAVAHPMSAVPQSEIGLAYWVLAKWEDAHGKDPTPSIDMAVSHGRRAVELDPSHEPTRAMLGLVYLDKAICELEAGQDPRRMVDLAVQELKGALALDARDEPVMLNLAMTYLFRLDYEVSHDVGDPQHTAQEAMMVLARVGKATPYLFWSERTIGNVHRCLAEYRRKRSMDPTEEISQAREHLENALSAAPSDQGAWASLTDLFVLQARCQIDSGRSPMDSIRLAKEACRKGLAINPDHPGLRDVKAAIAELEAEWRGRRK
ncbi:MAG: protein kinase [Acidobacteriota bacterium]